ncbi:uncharacterized protein C18orf63 homolog [Leptodactylus fuscus]
MSSRTEESIFFWDLPDLKNLCAVRIVTDSGILHPDIREKQITLCRCLLFLSDHVLSSPLPEDFSQILVITSKTFYKTGKLQSCAEKQQVKIERPERVTPVMLQTCLLYTVTARLAPYWNKAGHLLIQGTDFLTKSGKQDAVEIFISVLDNQLVITVRVHTIRMAPCQLCDFDVGPECFQNPLAWTRKKNCSSNWCYVLPSMKMGQIVYFSREIPPECPLKSYKDFQNYWKTLYGYELPHMSEDEAIYCSVYFKLIGEKLFTYPFICLRSQPIQFYPRADLNRVLNTFVDDLKIKMPHLCGFPVSMNNTPVYPVKELTRPLLQGSNKHLTNLTATVREANPKTSDQSVYSTEMIHNTASVDESLEHCSENLENPTKPDCIKIKNDKKGFDNPSPRPCPFPPLSEKQSCILASLVPGKNKSDSIPKNAEPSQSQVFDSCQLNYTNDIICCISTKRKEDHNVTENVKTFKRHIAALQLHEDHLQEENLVVLPEKSGKNKTENKLDVEQHAKDNKLFKLKNAALQDWLKQHGISARTRDKKEQLVAKIMEFIQQS